MKQIIISTIFICACCFTAVAQEQDIECPSISITGPASVPRPGEEQVFKAEIGRVAEKYNIEYVWAISTGKIVSGQGTKILTVESEFNNSVTVTIEVKGLPEKCPNSVSETAMIALEYIPILSDRFENFGRSGTKARIDSFLADLTNNKNAEGIVIFQDDKSLLKNIRFFRDQVVFRQFPLTRISVIVSDQDIRNTEFWGIPAGTDFDYRNTNLITKLEDFEALQKVFTPKPVKNKTKK